MKVLSLILSLFAFQSHASTWPTFFYPDEQLLMDLGAYDNEGCAWNTVRLKPNVINVKNYTCETETFCPAEWKWTARTDGNCHSFPAISFKEYKIIHHATYDTIIAIYGARNSNEIFFEYEMNTTPGDSWYCTQYKQWINYIVCACDT